MGIESLHPSVAWAFIRRGTTLAGAGAAIGLIAAVVMSGAIRSMLFGVGPHDVFSFGAGIAVVMVIALLASWVPAWRASKIDPLTALHHQ